MVSSRDSPLAVLEAFTFKLTISAESFLAAISKVVRVRVEFSKKMLKMLLPASRSVLRTCIFDTSRKSFAWSRMRSKMALGSPSVESRWVSSPLALSCMDLGIF